MKIDDLWATYEQATDTPGTIVAYVFLGILAISVIWATLSALNDRDGFGGWLFNLFFYCFFGGLVGFLLCGLLSSILTSGAKTELAESVRARAMIEHSVDLPADVYRQTLFDYDDEEEEAEAFFGRLEGESAVFVLGFDRDDTTVHIATESTKSDDTKMNVLTD